MTAITPLDQAALPADIRARFAPNGAGLVMHVLEAGFEAKGRPCILLLHEFPEPAYSWRKVMLPLAAKGFHVVAADQRLWADDRLGRELPRRYWLVPARDQLSEVPGPASGRSKLL